MHDDHAADRRRLARVARGDPEALRELYERFGRRVHAVALRRLGDQAAAEDVVQEVFVAVWRGAAGYRIERGSPDRWIFAIARNKVRDHWRRVERTAQLAGAAPDPREQAVRSAGLDRRAADARLLVGHVLATLTPLQAAAVRRVYLEDETFVVAAHALGVPLGTLKSRIHAALETMRAALEGQV